MTDTAITTTETGIAQYAPAVNEYLRASKSRNTIRAYRSDWEDFDKWCEANSVQALPAAPEVVCAYLTSMVTGGKKYSTIARRVASISKAHQAAGHESPTRGILVRDTLKGIARTITTAKSQAVPLRLTDIRKIAYALPDNLQAKRDLALLLAGYIMAGRRSEVVALNIEDVTFTREGMRLAIRKSKTDQAGEGETFGVNFCRKDPTICPVKALNAWIVAAGITSGPIFRAINRHGQLHYGRLNDKAVERIVRKYAPECSGHSLRAGFVTDQYAAGTPEAVIAERSRHKSRVVMGSYRREANVFAFDYLSAVL